MAVTQREARSTGRHAKPISNPGIGRAASSASLATLVSRLVGFVRNLVLVAALGTSVVADSYNLANNVPNMIFLMLGGGTVASVFIPRIVEISSESEKKANQYCTLLVLASVVAGLLATGLVIAAMTSIIPTLAPSASGTGDSTGLTRELTLWCAPQVLFFAVIAILSQIANAKGKFAAVAWLYSISSVAVISGCIAIMYVGTVDAENANSMSDLDVTILGSATLIGTIVQTVVLALIISRIGFRYALPRSVRGFGMRQTASTGLWTVLTAAIFQVTNMAVAFLSVRAGLGSDEHGRGYTALNNAQMLLYFVQAILIASLSNVLLQRLSISIANDNKVAAVEQLRQTVFKITSILIPITGLGVIAAPPLAAAIFSFGASSVESGKYIGLLLAIYFLGLIPFGLHVVVLRPYYAGKLGVPPLWSALRVCALWVGISLIAFFSMPSEYITLGFVVAFGCAYTIDLPVKLYLLRRVGYTNVLGDVRSLRKLSVIAVFSCGAGAVTLLALARLVDGIDSTLTLLIASLCSGVVFLLVYLSLSWHNEGSVRAFLRWMAR